MNLLKRNIGIFAGNPILSVETPSDPTDLTDRKGFLDGELVDLIGLDASELDRVRYSFDSNSRLYLAKHQLAAFEIAVEFARAYRNQQIRMVVGIDHMGKFEHNFLDPKSEFYSKPNLSGRRITLADMHPEIRDPFENIARRFGIILRDIRVCSEGIARANVKNIAEQMPRGSILREAMYRRQKKCRGEKEHAKNDSRRPSVTCEAVVAMYLYAAAKYGAEEVHAFWCDSDHSRRQVVDSGTKIFNELVSRQLLPTTSLISAPISYHLEDSKIARITGVSRNAIRFSVKKLLDEDKANWNILKKGVGMSPVGELVL